MIHAFRLRTVHIIKMLYISAIVAFCSLFFFNFFVDGFIITISVIVLPVLLYFYSNLNSFVSCLFVAVISPTFRAITLLVSGVQMPNAIRSTWPEVFFYMCYGLVFYMVFSRRGRKLNHLIVAVFAADLLSNYLEMALRLKQVAIPLNIFRGLAMIALVRMIIAVAIVLILKHFSVLVVREEHEKNYRHLLLMTSNFWSEIFFMEKNINYIEQLMAKAFNMYRYAESTGADEEIVRRSLAVAKDVHEVKKDYLRVIKGLEAITEKRLSNTLMGIDEIIDVIAENTRKRIRHQGANVDLLLNVKSKAKVKYHFYMTSVIQNLVSNAVESFAKNKSGVISISVTEQEDALVMTVTDNGQGVKPRDIDYIFNPGFSSKYTDTSGDVKRGLGLSIVKGLVENEFAGTIDVDTQLGKGTSFKLTIQKEHLAGG